MSSRLSCSPFQHSYSTNKKQVFRALTVQLYVQFVRISARIIDGSVPTILSGSSKFRGRFGVERAEQLSYEMVVEQKQEMER